jgi:hypothetical protein
MANTKLDQSRILNASAIGKQVLSAADAAAIRTLVGIPADIPFVTAPKAYTPTLTGFGSLSLVKARSWRVGNILYGIVDATTGAAADVEARVSLGYDGTDGNVHIDSQWDSFRFIAGKMMLSTALAVDISLLGLGGDNFLRIGVQNSGNGGLNPIHANALGSAFAFSLNYAVEIEEW